jgi:hypothetical protein
MLNIGRGFNAISRKWKSPAGLVFSRPLVLLQSDDWGRVGVRDRDAMERLAAAGVKLGEHPYDFYSLETAEDVGALQEMLCRHRDSTGRPPCLVMNFVVANLDFARMADEGFRKLYLQPLADGLPGKWERPGLFEAYRNGTSSGVFYPGLHGSTHFCRSAVEAKLATDDKVAGLLRTLWREETPYIHWRMPWIGFEYWNPEGGRFLEGTEQASLIRESAELFRKTFSKAAFSACAPGYRANRDTRSAWEQCGIRVVQNGGGGTSPISIDDMGMLETFRNVDFEPATAGSRFSLHDCAQRAQENLDRGTPAVISVHAINFHSTLRDFRNPTLMLLDRFLSLLEARCPDLLYVNDADLYELATTGRYEGLHGTVQATVSQSGLFRRVAGRR